MYVKIWLTLIVIAVCLGVIGYFVLPKSSPPTKSLVESVTQNVGIASPTPIPFSELTIPYLRQKEYKSILGELELVNQNSNYTSYLTSYTSDGLKINGLLTQPVGEIPKGGWPAIIFIHGYIPPTQYQTLTRYVDHVDFLARNDFVVFKIDLRGHGESQGEPSGAYYSPDYVIDTLNAQKALQSSDFVSKQKIGLWGHSMAGNVVARAQAVDPKIPAVVIWAGAGFSYLDLQEYGIQDSSYMPPQLTGERQKRREQLFSTHGRPSAASQFWKQVAPTTYLNELKGAVELHHAVNDEVVDIRYSRNLNSLLNQTSVLHELHEYESGGHNITGIAFNQAMQRTVDFFKKYLK